MADKKKGSMSAKLTDKQKRFVDEYLIDLNATQAAIRAGYSQKNADKIGAELLGKTRVSEYIQKRMKAREKRTEITQDKVLNELAKIAFANGSDFAKVAKRTGKRPMYQIDAEGIIEKDNNGKPIVIGYEDFEYQAVEIKNTDELAEDKRAAIATIKETKFGISVESCDKVKALELLGKHLGMFVDKNEIEIKELPQILIKRGGSGE